MLKKYKLMIHGTVLKREPLTGDADDPISIFPIDELTDKPDTGYSYRCLEYNIDEGWCEIELEADEILHTWLEAVLADGKEIQNVMKTKKLTLDKSALDTTILRS